MIRLRPARSSNCSLLGITRRDDNSSAGRQGVHGTLYNPSAPVLNHQFNQFIVEALVIAVRVIMLYEVRDDSVQREVANQNHSVRTSRTSSF
jgi:hypothetical protein